MKLYEHAGKMIPLSELARIHFSAGGDDASWNLELKRLEAGQ